MSTRDSGDWAAMRVTSGPEEARQAAPAAAVRKKLLRLADGFGFSIIYLAFICSTVSEYGGKVRVKLVPRPSTAAVTGTILVGSVMELVSVGLAALSVIGLSFGVHAGQAAELDAQRLRRGGAIHNLQEHGSGFGVARGAPEERGHFLRRRRRRRHGGGGVPAAAPAGGCPPRRPGAGGCHVRVGTSCAVTGRTTSPR